MDKKYNKELYQTARVLRNSMTAEERKLWYEFLRKHPVKFMRQKVLGNHIVDFYSAQAQLVIEVDGAYHQSENEKAKDQARTQYLQQYGLIVLRVHNDDINRDFSSVCKYLDSQISLRLQSPQKCAPPTTVERTKVQKV